MSEWPWKYDEPEVENVTRGRSPSVTFHPRVVIISMSHERLCVMFCRIPTTKILNYKWLTVAKSERVSSAIHLKMRTVLIAVRG